jgi:hypothetical protein
MADDLIDDGDNRDI